MPAPRKRTITAKRETVTGELALTETTSGLPSMGEAWATLTAPLEHYEFPVWPQSWWAACDAYRDQLAADWGPEGVAAFGDAAEAVAREATFGPCRDPLLRQAAIMPAMLP